MEEIKQLNLSRYASKFKFVKPTSEKQVLAAEIYEYFHKRIPFVRIATEIKRLGVQCVREVFIETRKSDCRNERALFLWKLSQIKVILKEI